MEDETGISQGDLSSFESGKKNVSADHIDAILAAFETDARAMILELAKMVIAPGLEGVVVPGNADVDRVAATVKPAAPTHGMREPPPEAVAPPPPPTHTLAREGYRKKDPPIPTGVSGKRPTTRRGG
jgi:transcriptional regulator with XRE-family HTH domain